MKIVIDSPHIVVDDKLTQLINQKIGAWARWCHRIVTCNVVLKKEHNDQQMNYTISARLEVRGKSLFAKEQAESFELALQRINDDMRHQLFHYRRKQYGREEIW